MLQTFLLLGSERLNPSYSLPTDPQLTELRATATS